MKTLSAFRLSAGVSIVAALLLPACTGSPLPAPVGQPEIPVPEQTVSVSVNDLPLMQDEVDDVRLTRTVVDEPLAIDFSETATGISIDRRACDPPKENCELWRVAPRADAADRGYRVTLVRTRGNVGEQIGAFDVEVFPQTPLALAPAQRIAAAPHASFAILSDGSVHAWGRPDVNRYDPPPDVIGDPLARPVAALPAGERWVALAGSDAHTLALAADGRVWAWGANTSGQLGVGSTDRALTAVRVEGLDDVIAIAAGEASSLALRRDGTVWNWGRNAFVAGGYHARVGSDAPAPVPLTGRYVQIALAGDRAVALRDDGSVWMWYFTFDEDTFAFPTMVPLAASAQAIATGEDHSLVVESDGTVETFGANRVGQLGDGTQLERTLPVRVPDLADVVAVAAGEQHSLALTADGRVFAWGANEDLQLGAGHYGLRSATPVLVSPLPGATAIAASGSHSVALAADCAGGGTVYAWGNNDLGQLGHGAFHNRAPTPVVGIGDARVCGSRNVRLYVYLSGEAFGSSVQSDRPDLHCDTRVCWQEVPRDSYVTLSAIPSPGRHVLDWRWDCAGNGVTTEVFMSATRLCKVRFDVGTPVPPPPPPPPPDFRVNVSPATLSLDAGDDASVAVTLELLTGTFSESFDFAAAAPGLDATFSPARVTLLEVIGERWPTLRIAAPASLAPGEYSVSVAATTHGVTRNAIVRVTVSGAAPPPGTEIGIEIEDDPVIVARGGEAQTFVRLSLLGTATRGQIGPVSLAVVESVPGFSFTFHPQVMQSPVANSALDVVPTAAVAPGTYTFTVRASSELDTATAALRVTVTR